MSWHLRCLCWRAVLVCCLLLSFTRIAQNVPSHISLNYLGYAYWEGRYSLGYTDWPGFWNNNNDGRREYNRANSEFSGRSCGGCACSDENQKATCSGPAVNV